MFILFVHTIIWLIIFNESISATPSWRRFYDVENLIAEPDYRAVNLRWNYYNEHGLKGFRVKFCEISAWNSKIRCRERHLQILSPQTSRKLSQSEETLNDVIQDKLVRVNKGTYEASIYDLRMLTNYTFNVKAEFDSTTSYGLSAFPIFYSKIPFANNRPHTGNSDFDSDYHRNVIVETKSFSARTSRCLANTSDVIVNTGPYFSGKISVENANNNRCSIYGNRSNAHNEYTLQIIHDICGSKIINNSRIETMVIVHENKEILTHNSRRFLVVCNFVPETFTLTASVAVPPYLLKRKKPDGITDNHSIHSNEANINNNKNFNEFASKPKPALSSSQSERHASSESETYMNERSNDIFTFDNYKQHNSVRDSRMLAHHSEHRILPHITNNNGKSIDDHYWNNFFSTILFVISGLIFCVIALLWFTTTPQLSDKNEKEDAKPTTIGTIGSLTPSSVVISEKLNPNNNNAIVSVNGSPVALISVNTYGGGESYA